MLLEWLQAIQKEVMKPKGIAGIVGFITIVIVLAIMFDAQNDRRVVAYMPEIHSKNWEDYINISHDLPGIKKSINEGEEVLENISINQTNIYRIKFTLQWSDEPARDMLHTNEPDTFQLLVNDPKKNTFMSEEVSNPQNEMGIIELEISITLESPPESKNGTGSWLVKVNGINFGDQKPKIPIGRTFEDKSNSWELKIEYMFKEGKKG